LYKGGERWPKGLLFDIFSRAKAQKKKLNRACELPKGQTDMSTSKQRQFANQASLKQALFAGAIAGTAVDTALFPLGENYISFSRYPLSLT
jgi:hypothetical protein